MKRFYCDVRMPKRSASLVAACASALLAVCAGAPAYGASVILIDLNENANSPLPGGTWNTYATPANINGGALLDSTNALTSITLSVSGTITDNTSNGGTVVFNPNQPGYEGLPSWVASTTANGAAGDNFFTSNTVANAAQSYTLTLSGLTPGDVFSLNLLASRDSTSALGFFEYSLDGGSTWQGFTVLNADGSVATTNGWDTNTTAQGTGGQAFALQSQGYQLHRYMNVSNVELTGSTLAVRTTDGNTTTSTFSAMNAMQLTIVPEPSSAALLLMGGMGLCGMLRRRRA